MTGILWRRFDAVARRQPDRAAFIFGERQVSYGMLRVMANQRAAEFARSGLRAGQRCVIWASNSPELAAVILGAWRLGAVIVLINDEAPASHFAHALDLTSPAIAIVEDKALEVARSHDGVAILPLSPSLRDEPELSLRAEIHDQEAASIFFTSGSTGLPKGVVQSHANLLAGCMMVSDHLGFRSDDRILCPIPWSFDYGYGQFLSTVLLGVTQILPETRNPFALCEAMTHHRPTVLAGLPSIFGMLLRGISPIRETDVSSLRLITNTGGKIAPAIFDDVLDIFGHCEISLNYGMTETYRSAGLPVALARENPASVGFAYPGVAISVLRPDGTETDPGEEGEIVHRGTGVFLGYWGNVDATLKTRRPDPLWRHEGVAPPMAVFSGDLGWKDEAGLLYVKGRRDRLLKSMGVRVSPDEIEALIRQSGLVRDVAIVGVPHDVIGDMVVAAIKPREDNGNPLDDLKAFALEKMSNFMQPRDYRIVEEFPLTPNGKPDFRAIRELFLRKAA